MAGVYKTKSGDAWDYIAYKAYGSADYVSFLMENNKGLLGYFVFPEGVSVNIEDLPEEESILPDWRNVE